RSLVALEAIEDLARQTVEDIDRIVGTLRERDADTGAVESPIGLASLDTLVAHHIAAGLDVTVDAEGAPRPLVRPADQAAYRILQEALTNASRHGVNPVHVEVGFGDTAVDIAVTNPTPAGASGRVGGGHGIVGMRERAVLVDGDLQVDR